MNILIGLLIAVEIVVSILLTLIILVQPSKSGGGLGGALGGGGMSEQLFGARTGNVLTKATIVFASIFLLNTVALAAVYSRADKLSVPAPAAPSVMSAAEETLVPEAAADVESVEVEIPETETLQTEETETDMTGMPAAE
ncbi:MAG: preprotein translocase subunit SecG [Kiritimatiellia bacterium]